ncbi:hypothetical protein FJZ40_01455 [Candidatus Shapirobacteria bacterium]|nr:hypothetical protein [Candidatus Shapirobacteria bacterium]
MTKYLPYAIIVVLIVGAVVFMSGRLNPGPGTRTAPQDAKVTASAEASPIPISKVDQKDKASVPVAIDAELNQIDKEISEIKDTNLDASGLSDEQLGL